MFIAALLLRWTRTLTSTITRTWKQPRCRLANEWISKLWYNGIFLSYKKEHIWVNSNEVDETRACYTKWSKSEGETQILYINTYVWNLGWQLMTILYSRQQKRHRYKEQTFRLCGRRRGWDDLREWYWNMYIILCKTDDHYNFNAWNRVPKASTLGQPRGIRLGASGWGGHMYTHGWFMLMYGENHHSVVKQLSSN